MNREFWEEFVTCPLFVSYSAAAHEILIEKMTGNNPTEAISSEAIVSHTLGPKVSTMGATPIVPMTPRFPRPKQTVTKDKQPTMK